MDSLDFNTREQQSWLDVQSGIDCGFNNLWSNGFISFYLEGEE